MCVRVGGEERSILTQLPNPSCDFVRLLQGFFFQKLLLLVSTKATIFPSPHCEGESRGYHRSGRTRDKNVLQTEELLFGLLKAQGSICGFQSLPNFSLVF